MGTCLEVRGGWGGRDERQGRRGCCRVESTWFGGGVLGWIGYIGGVIGVGRRERDEEGRWGGGEMKRVRVTCVRVYT